jgi:hypothetical protein
MRLYCIEVLALTVYRGLRRNVWLATSSRLGVFVPYGHLGRGSIKTIPLLKLATPVVGFWGFTVSFAPRRRA